MNEYSLTLGDEDSYFFSNEGHDNAPFHEQYPDEYKTKINISDSTNLLSNVNDGNWFVDNAPDDNTPLPSPQPIFLKYKIAMGVNEIIQADEIWITMDNGTIQEPLDGTRVKIYNIFEIDGSYPHLFNSEDFAEFIPTDITQSFQNKRQHFRSYTGNLIHTDNNYQEVGTSNGFPAHSVFWFLWI